MNVFAFAASAIKKKVDIQKRNNSIKKSSNKEEKEVKSIIKTLIVGNEDDKQVRKIKEYIEDYFFTKIIIKKNEFIKIYKNSDITLEIISIPFDQLNYYSQNKYNYVISLCSKKEENYEIIKIFGKTLYIMKRICSKIEILENCSDLIESTDLLLVNHFRKEINKIFNMNSDKTVSQSILSTSSKNTNDDIKIMKKDFKIKNNFEEYLEESFICPIGQEIMKDPVITPSGHTFERKNIVDVIRKTGKCPMTRKALEEKNLVPNLSIKNLIECYYK